MYIITENSIRATLPELHILTGYPDLIKICHQQKKFETSYFIILRWNFEPNRYELIATEGHEKEYNIFVEHAQLTRTKEL